MHTKFGGGTLKRYFFVLAVLLAACFAGGCGNNSPTAADTVGYDTEKIGWGLKKVENSSPEVPRERSEMLKRYDGYYLGNTTEKVMYLTFDEGYENGYTAQILDVLKKTGTKAAFFVTGPYIKTQPELVKRMTDEGHIVGNHTVNHPSMPDISDEEIEKELTELDKMYFELTGKHTVYMRPPRGEYSEKSLAKTKELGYKSVFWSVAYADWDTNSQKGAEYAVSQVTKQFHPGAVILLHAVSKDNADGLEEIINTARGMGYEFLSLENL